MAVAAAEAVEEKAIQEAEFAVYFGEKPIANNSKHVEIMVCIVTSSTC